MKKKILVIWTWFVSNMLGRAHKQCLHNDIRVVVKNPNLQHSHVIYTMMAKVCNFNSTM